MDLARYPEIEDRLAGIEEVISRHNQWIEAIHKEVKRNGDYLERIAFALERLLDLKRKASGTHWNDTGDFL